MLSSVVVSFTSISLSSSGNSMDDFCPRNSRVVSFALVSSQTSSRLFLGGSGVLPSAIPPLTATLLSRNGCMDDFRPSTSPSAAFLSSSRLSSFLSWGSIGMLPGLYLHLPRLFFVLIYHPFVGVYRDVSGVCVFVLPDDVRYRTRRPRHLEARAPIKVFTQNRAHLSLAGTLRGSSLSSCSSCSASGPGS